MGMATSKVRLNICGSSYVVNTSESEDYMQNLADRLNLDMNELMVEGLEFARFGVRQSIYETAGNFCTSDNGKKGWKTQKSGASNLKNQAEAPL